MLLPLNGNVPRWYELGLSKIGLIVSAHPVIKTVFESGLNSSDANHNTKQLKIPVFVPPTKTGYWGHGSVFAPVAAQIPGWLAWECRWPTVHELHLPYEAWAVSASLQFLFMMLMGIREENTPKDPDKPQLMTVDGVRADIGMMGGALDMTISPALYPWVKSFPDGVVLPTVAKSMYEVHTRLIGNASMFKCHKHEFKCFLQHPDRINLEVPGNARSLDPVDWSRDEDRPMRMTSHNTDGPIPQLTLLAGMAAIHDLARSQGF